MPNAQKPKRRLKNLTVEFISLVDAGANRREVIYKNAEAQEHGQRVNVGVQIRKVDDEKGIVFGVVYAPNENDTHGDTMFAEDIEKAAHDFLAAGKTNRVDKQHDQDPDEGHVIESFILKGSHPEFPDDPEGTWCVAIKVANEDTREQIKNGEIKGISLDGFAEFEDLEAEEVVKSSSILAAINEMKNIIRKQFGIMEEGKEGTETPNTDITFEAVMKSAKSKAIDLAQPIQKDFSGALASEHVRQAVNALDRANWNALHDDEQTDKVAALITNANQFITYLNGLTEIQKQTTKTEDTSMSTPETTATPESVAKNEEGKSPELQAIEKLADTVNGLATRVEQVEKSAGTSKAAASQDEPEGGLESVQKSYKGLNFTGKN